MEGIILKGVGSFYTICDDTQREYICKARGKFRKDGITPVPGDRVVFSCEQGEEGEGRIETILPRKNLLIRPAVANIDKLLIVLSVSAPQPDLLLSDKLLLQCEQLHILPVIIWNKWDDQADDCKKKYLLAYAGCSYRVLTVSAKTGEGISALKDEIHGCICCFAGQSAVGKSSLLNCVLPELHTQTGDLSRKTERGRHTTRHAQLWSVFGGAILDTPGFSLLDLGDIEPWELSALYPEMRSLRADCRFSECLHVSEPDCAVKKALSNGAFNQQRYERYLVLLNELKEKRKRKYD